MATLLDRLRALDAEQRRYTLDTLVARLRDVDQVDRLRVLFADDLWMQGRYEGDGGVYAGYRADLAIAWESLATAARTQIESDGDVPGLADLWRIALIRTSLNSVAGNYPPALVAQAIRTGFWTADRIVGVIPDIADVEQRLEVCLALLQSDRTSALIRSNTQKLALDLAVGLKRTDKRSNWLVKLATVLDNRAAETAMQSAQLLTSAEERIPALLAISLRIDEPRKTTLLEEALRTAQSVKPLHERVAALTQVVKHADTRRRDRALRDALIAARRLGAGDDRVAALAALIGYRSGKAEDTLVKEVLDGLWELDPKSLGFVLGKVMPHLPPSLQRETADAALERAKEMDDMDREYDAPRPVALMALAPYLDADGIDRALEIAQSMSEGDHLTSLRANVYASLAQRMKGREQQRVVADALRLARQIGFGPDVASALTDVIPLLENDAHDSLVREALNAAFALSDEKPNEGFMGDVSHRLKALANLAPFLTGQLLGDALGNARVIKDHKERALAYLSLAQLLDGDERQHALRLSFEAVWAIRNDQMGIFTIEKVFAALEGDAARAAFAALDDLPKEGYPNHWVSAFVALAPRLTGREIEPAAKIVEHLKQATDRAEAYTALAARAEPEHRDRYQRLVIESIRAISTYSVHLIAYAIRDAAPYLQGEHANAAWEIVVGLERFERSEAIMAMSSRLDGDVAVSAFPVVRDLDNPYHRTVGLLRLSAALPDELKAEARAIAFQTAVAMGDADLESEKAVLELLPHVQGDEHERLIERGLARAAYFGHEEMGSRAFAQLAPFMTGARKAAALDEALTRALRWDEPGVRVDLLATIFDEMDADGLQRALATTLKIKTAEDRFEVLASLARFLPAVDVRTVRKQLIERLFSLREQNRAETIAFLGHPGVFAAPIVSNALRARLVRDIDEICSRWSWK